MAFLYAKLKEDIYVQPSKGMEGISDCKALRLLKNNTSNEFVESVGFKRCLPDHFLCVRRNCNKDIIMMVLYIDDIVITGSDLEEVKMVK